MKITKKTLFIIILNVFPSIQIYNNCISIGNFNLSNNFSNVADFSLQDFFFKKLKSEKMSELRDEEEGIKIIDVGLNKEELTIKLIDLKKQNAEEELRILSILKKQDNFASLKICVYDEIRDHLYLFQKRETFDLSKNRSDFFKIKKTEVERLKFYKKLFKIINRLHSSSYIHGSITPWNIQISEDFKKILFTNFSSSTKIGENAKGGSEATLSLEKYIDKNTITRKTIDIFSLGMSIIILEMGEEKVLDILNKSMWSVKFMEYGSVRRKGLKDIGKRYDKGMEEPGFFGSLKKWFVGIFFDNRIDRIYNFSDVLKNMTDSENTERLDLLDLIGIMDKIIEIYEPKYIEKNKLKKQHKLDLENEELDKFNFASMINKKSEIFENKEIEENEERDLKKEKVLNTEEKNFKNEKVLKTEEINLNKEKVFDTKEINLKKDKLDLELKKKNEPVLKNDEKIEYKIQTIAVDDLKTKKNEIKIIV